jgi:fibronectin type 3 domain-containing protein
MSTTAPVVELPGVTLAASSTLPVTITVPQDVITAGKGSVQAAMYGQLLASYTPASGPSRGTALSANQWVYFTGSDYAAVGSSVPAFATYKAATTQTLQLPAVYIQAAHILFGVGKLPPIAVTGSNEPQQPTPTATASVYDFVEFTWNAAGALYINTSMIDQFGVPVQIQITPPDRNLPSGAGVYMPRADVFTRFAQQVPAAFAQCAQDAFGQPQSTRIYSPAQALMAKCVQGVVANPFQGPPSTLPAGTYWYAVSALNKQKAESYVQSTMAKATTTAGQAVTVAWAPNANQPAGVDSYNVYRGTPGKGGAITWGLLGNVPASQFKAGGAFADTGQAVTSAQPKMNPLATYLDGEIQKFFQGCRTQKLTLTATDGTTNGYVYTFTGSTTNDKSGRPQYLQLTLTSVTSGGKKVSSPPIPLKTPFNIYYPYWNTNTFNPAAPAPPTWALYNNVPASMMVFAAQGVFADNAQQAQSNLPAGVTNAAIYSTLLGSLENQVVAAITRGIANLSTLSPLNWGNGTAPTQLAPTQKGSGKLQVGTTYYYVVTAVNANGETVGSLEFSAKPTPTLRAVQVNWAPMSTSTTAFRVYRGTAPGQENKLVGTVTNNGTAASFLDTGAAGTAQAPPAYFPAGIPADGYDQFFHNSSVSRNGAAYAAPYDDQGGQSSTLSTSQPSAIGITLAW